MTRTLAPGQVLETLKAPGPTPVDLAASRPQTNNTKKWCAEVFSGSKAAVLTYGLTDAEEARFCLKISLIDACKPLCVGPNLARCSAKVVDCRYPGHGTAEKAAREKAVANLEPRS